jgi:cytochrome c biogenesis protein CcmG/thiol:disulfide interchange protein DsbE
MTQLRKTRHLFPRVLSTAAFLGVCCLLCPGSAAAPVAASQRVAAPDFTLDDAGGNAIRLRDYRGKVVLLDFWATWCTGCKVEIPWYMEFQKKYARRGLSSIGVAMDEEGWEKVRPYLRQKPIGYPIVVGDAVVAKTYGVTSLPVTLLIDRQGRIADAHTGMVKKSAWEREIQALLRER